MIIKIPSSTEIPTFQLLKATRQKEHLSTGKKTCVLCGHLTIA